MVETKNARIQGTTLGQIDHVFSFKIDVLYDGRSTQSGGYITLHKVGSPRSICGSMISRILEVVDVSTWEELPGAVIRVKADHDKLHAIGHYLEDKWLNFADFADDHKSE
jgi:hypothetical protein